MRRLLGLLGLLLVWGALLAQTTERIGAGDKVRITVEGDASLSRVYTIDPQGNLTMPLIGTLQAIGRTPAELASEIAKRLREGNFFRDPKVSVEIVERAKAIVSVTGAVRRAGELELGAGWRLADALRVAEPTSVADLSAVRLERLDGTRQTINHLRFIQEGDEGGNPLLQAGDRIFVPLSPAGQNVLVLGALRSPGSYPYSEARTLLEAIARAGGTLPDADTSQITLRRANQAEPTRINLNTLTGDLELQPGDQITVPFRATRQFIVVRGGVRNPGLVNYVEGMTLTQAIDAAGGPVAEARLERVVILRPAPQGNPRRITVNLLEVAQGTRPDERVQPGDTVEVPAVTRRSASPEEPLRVVWLILSIIFLITRR
ncbi:MAG: SLBB domain-containing protein [Fimbriimonadales bacterium]